MKVDIYNTENKYDIILADPPWRQSKGGKKAVRANSSGKPLDYETLDIWQIAAILEQAASLTSGDSVMFLWTIEKYLHVAEEIATGLGYKLHARMIWNKVTGIPAAFTIRYGHEYLLYLYRGKLLPVAKSERGKIHSVFTEQVKRHSQKPLESYRIIRRLYPEQAKLELFARSPSEGFDRWGEEA